MARRRVGHACSDAVDVVDDVRQRRGVYLSANAGSVSMIARAKLNGSCRMSANITNMLLYEVIESSIITPLGQARGDRGLCAGETGR